VGLWEGLQLRSGVSSPVGSPTAKSFDAFFQKYAYYFLV